MGGVVPVCPRCHQPVRYARAGVHLGPSKVVMFDLLLQAGDIGLTADELMQGMAEAGRAVRSYNSLKSHVYQLRELLAGTDYRVPLDRAPPVDRHLRVLAQAPQARDGHRYFLTKRKGAAA